MQKKPFHPVTRRPQPAPGRRNVGRGPQDNAAKDPYATNERIRAREVAKQLDAAGVRAEIDDRNEKIGRKIRDNELKRLPYLLIVGEKEQENGEVSVRKQGEGDQGSMKIATFAENLNAEVEELLKEW